MKFFACTLALLVGSAIAAPFDSSDVTTVSTTMGETPTSLHECVGKKDGALVGDRHDKSIFYECINDGMAYRFHCPRGLIFDEESKSCTFDPDHPITHEPPHTSSKFDCSGKKDGFYEDRHDPTKFHECSNGLASDFDCPSGTMFEEKRQVCVYDPDWKSRTHEPIKSTEATTERHTTTTEEPTTTTEVLTSTTERQTTTTEEPTTITTERPTTTTEVPTTTEEETLPTESWTTPTTEAPTTTTEEPTTTPKPTTTEEPTTMTTTTDNVVNPFDPNPKPTRGHHD